MSQPRATVFGMLAALAMLAAPAVLAAPKHAVVPLPKPRPEAAPKAGAETAAETAPERSTDAPAPVVPQPSPCRQALTEDIAIAPSLPPIKGPGTCGGDDLVRLEAVVLPDKTRVALKPAATLRCSMASAVADWVRTDLVALAASLNTALSTVDNFDSFECRGRNRVAGAMLSEHGKANALDVRSVSFADGRELKLTDRSADRSLRETVLHSVCSRFSTVLGPDSDWYHEDHIHLDHAVRRSNYRICEWDVLDPMPAVAPMLPPARPDEAPPREAEDGNEQQAAKSDSPADDAEGKAQANAVQKPTAANAPGETTAAVRAKSKGRPKRAPLSLNLRKAF
ncbi:MAG: extensin family protein [Xanthobacteraceae bacterium]